MKKLIILLSLIFLTGIAIAAEPASVDPTASLSLGGSILDEFGNILRGFSAAILPVAKSLFVMLMLVELCIWGYKQFVNEIHDIGSLALKFSWNLFIWGFFGWLLLNSHDLLSAIIKSFFTLGEKATGLQSLDAVSLLNMGVETALSIPKAADLGALDFINKPLVVLTAVIAEIVLLLAFGVAAAQLVMAQIEAMIVISAAPIILAFGALSYTREMAAKVMSHAIATGVKVLTIYMLAGAMTKIGPIISATLAKNGAQLMSSPGQMLEIIGISCMMLLLAFFIPTVAGAMLSGQASMSGGSAISATMGALAGGAVAGAAGIGLAQQAAGGLASGASGVASGVSGLNKALSAGLSSASDHGLKGIGAGMHAAGKVAEHGIGMATSGIGSALHKASDSFSDKVANSTGNKIASSIENTRGGSISAAPAGGGSASGGSAPASGGSAADGPTSVSAAAGSPLSSSSGNFPDNLGAAVAPTAASSSAGTASGSGSAALQGYTPTGDASSASISGGSDVGKSKSVLGKIADATSNALGSTHDTLSRGRDNIIDDRTQVGAQIDTKASH